MLHLYLLSTTTHAVLVVDAALTHQIVVVNIASGMSLTRFRFLRLAQRLRALHYVHLLGSILL